MADPIQKLNDELEKLEVEYKHTESAISTKEACKKIVEFCQKTPDPFCGENETPNTWLASAKSGGGCTIF